jgi:hypothetical protein
MILKHVFVASSAAFLLIGNGPTNAGQTINAAGALACVTDKWDVKEPEKGHKLVDYAGRCVLIPADNAAPNTEDCVGKYEYMPDESYKGSGTCTLKFKEAADTLTHSWEEGSDLKDNPYKYTGGTGKYQGASGGGTYTYDTLTDTLSGGRYKGTIQLP